MDFMMRLFLFKQLFQEHILYNDNDGAKPQKYKPLEKIGHEKFDSR